MESVSQSVSQIANIYVHLLLHSRSILCEVACTRTFWRYHNFQAEESQSRIISVSAGESVWPAARPS